MEWLQGPGQAAMWPGEAPLSGVIVTWRGMGIPLLPAVFAIWRGMGTSFLVPPKPTLAGTRESKVVYVAWKVASPYFLQGNKFQRRP